MTGRIVVGFDGSEGSRRALEWALDEGVLRDASVTAISSWTPPVSVTGVPFDPAGYERLRDQGEAEVREALDSVVAEHQAAPAVEFRVVHQHPGVALIDGSKGADLLVVGSRGLGGFKGVLLGSTSSYCVHHAHVPVVVIRPPGASPI